MDLVKEMNYFYYKTALYELKVMNEHEDYTKLSYNTLLYLNIISQMSNCTVSKLADSLKVTKSAVTLKINELVKQGWVMKKQSDTDKRVYYLSISPKVEEIFGIYDKLYEKIEQDLKEKYTEEQLELFEELLHTISSLAWKKD